MNPLAGLSKLKKKWDKYTEGWFGVLVYLVLGFVIAYIFNMFLSLFLNTQTPVVAVFSESMIPTFFKGDMIIVYGTNNLKVGDIIVFEVPDRKYPIIHRIISMENGFIRTKGDNNFGEDPESWRTNIDNVYGRELLKIPLLGWVKILFVDITGFT